MLSAWRQKYSIKIGWSKGKKKFYVLISYRPIQSSLILAITFSIFSSKINMYSSDFFFTYNNPRTLMYECNVLHLDVKNIVWIDITPCNPLAPWAYAETFIGNSYSFRATITVVWKVSLKATRNSIACTQWTWI